MTLEDGIHLCANLASQAKQAQHQHAMVQVLLHSLFYPEHATPLNYENTEKIMGYSNSVLVGKVNLLESVPATMQICFQIYCFFVQRNCPSAWLHSQPFPLSVDFFHN